ncbi:hypothetical protein OVY01_02335 [Robbsia sp. Bb-Pol-6]|uniref:Uncharacterized protein n=1 Tax=Robbsia betulipollinis TaxID=2981849 RepID=A0ABT3ZHV6_9BURK|nr:hypothetical protein [Robbsia betulipollinis]MCY0386101.1 hypothetical protein [Robbsia betulipollinis]
MSARQHTNNGKNNFFRSVNEASMVVLIEKIDYFFRDAKVLYAAARSLELEHGENIPSEDQTASLPFFRPMRLA